MAAEDPGARQRVARVEELLERAERLPDPARGITVELLRAVVELYGEGLARVVAIAAESQAGLLERLAADGLVSHLLLLHGLHPQDVPARVRQALAGVGPRLGGAAADLVGVDGDLVRVRVRVSGGGGCGCGGGADLRATVQRAVQDAAPEVARVEVEEAAPPPVVVPLESLRTGPAGGRTAVPAGG